MKTKEEILFEEAPVGRAVLSFYLKKPLLAAQCFH